MSDAWMPGAGYLRTTLDGGQLKGGAPRAVWQALRADPRIVSARSAAQRLDQLGRPCHLVWNPLYGEIVQLIPIVRAGCLLGRPEGLEQPAGRPARGEFAAAQDQDQDQAAARWPAADLAEVNAEGRICVQIGVIAFAWEPFTSGPMDGLQSIMSWLDSWSIARRWPAGRPPAFPYGHATGGSRRIWARGGHFGASQVPGSTADGPGGVDTEMLTGRDGCAAIGRNIDRNQAGTDDQQAQRAAASMQDLDEIFESDEPAAAALIRVR
jgi:hypothetical protein